jgi:hypothetical protein
MLVLGLVPAVLSCTRGTASPFSAPDAGSATPRGGSLASGTAGHGGRTGTVLSTNPDCDMGLPKASDALAEQERLFAQGLNDQVVAGWVCGIPAAPRVPFIFRDSWRCASRWRAYNEDTVKTMGRPPTASATTPHATGGAAGSTASSQFVAKGDTWMEAWHSFAVATTTGMTTSGLCLELPKLKWTSAGVGHYGSTWVVTLATSD